jgi:xylulokinase
MKGVGLSKTLQVRVSGGGARSSIWRQILADVLGAELVTVNTTEGAAFGAALLAGVGVGTWANVDAACAAAIQVTGSTAPQVAAANQYDEVYRVYTALYPALKANFAQLAKVGLQTESIS